MRCFLVRSSAFTRLDAVIVQNRLKAELQTGSADCQSALRRGGANFGFNSHPTSSRCHLPIDSIGTADKRVRPMAKIHRALLSVSDKSGLIPFAQTLAAAGVELISTGGTAKALRDAGLAVKDISEHTGFPEMMDGRVKTLHPKVHGGLLFIRGNAQHEAAAKQHGIAPIDLVVVNLYPFEATVAKPGVSLHDAIENIDIGGNSSGQ